MNFQLYLKAIRILQKINILACVYFLIFLKTLAGLLFDFPLLTTLKIRIILILDDAEKLVHDFITSRLDYWNMIEETSACSQRRTFCH